MNNIKFTYVDKFFVALVVVILFSSDRNLLVTHYILGGSQNAGLITIPFILLALFFLFYILALRGRLIVRHSHRRLIVVSIILAIYFAAHEFIFGDGFTSLKYSIYILLINLALMVRYNSYFILKIIGYAGGLISLIVVLQQFLLLTIDGGDLSKFEVAIQGDEWARWLGCDFVNPYGLGLMERCIWGYDVYIGELKFNRSIFFSTEPKYFSSIILITFASLILSKTNSLAKRFFLLMHALAFLASASASAIIVLIISAGLVITRFIGPKIYTTSIFLLPIFILPIAFYLIISLTGIDGFLLNRVASAFSSMGDGQIQAISIFGQSTQECEKALCRDMGLVGNVTEVYCLVGFSIYWDFIYFVTKPLFNLLKNNEIEFSNRFGLALLLNTYVVFNIYFFSDIFNMFGVLIILTIILLPDYILEQRRMLSSENYLNSNNSLRAI